MRKIRSRIRVILITHFYNSRTSNGTKKKKTPKITSKITNEALVAIKYFNNILFDCAMTRIHI